MEKVTRILRHLSVCNQTEAKRYAIFVCGPVPPNPVGDYADMFIKLLYDKNHNAEYVKFNVYKDEFPTKLELTDLYDGIIVSGSVYDAYSDEKWIIKLRELIVYIYDYNNNQIKNNKKIIKMIGVCFGHQVIAHSLNGGRADKNNKTIWEIGTKKIRLTNNFNKFIKKFNGLQHMSSLLSVNVLVSHRDAVLSLPYDATLLAYSDKTDVEMYHIGNQILCCQGHPEFSKYYLQILIENHKKSPSVPQEEIKYAINSLKQQIHYNFFKQLFIEFLK